MCTQCVAEALPYVGMAVGGLKAMTWNASRATARRDRALVEDPAAPAEPADDTEPALGH